MDIRIQQIEALDRDDLGRVTNGYSSSEKYLVRKSESNDQASFSLQLVTLAERYEREPELPDEEALAHYALVSAAGFSFSAYSGGSCVGLAIAEPHRWNRSLWVFELQVAQTHRGNGIGRMLVEALAESAHVADLRTIVCETQTTNVPAIRFYRRMGFQLEGIDLSYYSNRDYPDGEMAVFMKLSLEQ